MDLITSWISLLTVLLGLMGSVIGVPQASCFRESYLKSVSLCKRWNLTRSDVTYADSVMHSGVLLLQNTSQASEHDRKWTWVLFNDTNYRFVGADGEVSYRAIMDNPSVYRPSMVLRLWREWQKDPGLDEELFSLVKTTLGDEEVLENAESETQEQWVVQTGVYLAKFNVSFNNLQVTSIEGHVWEKSTFTFLFQMEIRVDQGVWTVKLKLSHWILKGTFGEYSSTGSVSLGESKLISWDWKGALRDSDRVKQEIVGNQGVIKWSGRTHTYWAYYEETPSHAYQGGIAVRPSHDHEVTEPIVRWECVWTPLADLAVLPGTARQELHLTWEVVPFPIRMSAYWRRESHQDLDSLVEHSITWNASSKRGDWEAWSRTTTLSRSENPLLSPQVHVEHATCGGRYGSQERGIGDGSIVNYQLGVDRSAHDDQGRSELQVRHNLTSPYYTFESNMSTAYDEDQQALVTWITQKGQSPVWEVLNVTLKQIFSHAGEIDNWETSLMLGGLVDMHVRAQWKEPLAAYYSKLFQFHSHSEDVVPTMNWKVSYRDHTWFYHQLQFPKWARNVECLLEFQDALVLTVLTENEFKSDRTIPIARWRGTGKRLDASLDVKEWYEIGANLAQYFSKVGRIWKEAASREDHPINILLKPILGSTLQGFSQGIREVLFRLSKEFFAELPIF